VLQFVPGLLLHVSRGVRWDSDHVVIGSDELQAIAHELVRGNYLDRTHIGLDYFDASINRIAAWVIGIRSTLRALMFALLEPTEHLRAAEVSGNYTQRLALLEELKTYPFGAVWDQYCVNCDAPIGNAWMDQVTSYASNVLSRRSAVS
jgi:L-rhamnose isomerase